MAEGNWSRCTDIGVEVMIRFLLEKVSESRLLEAIWGRLNGI